MTNPNPIEQFVGICCGGPLSGKMASSFTGTLIHDEATTYVFQRVGDDIGLWRLQDDTARDAVLRLAKMFSSIETVGAITTVTNAMLKVDGDLSRALARRDLVHAIVHTLMDGGDVEIVEFARSDFTEFKAKLRVVRRKGW